LPGRQPRPERDHRRGRARQRVHPAGDPQRLPSASAALPRLPSLRADPAPPGRLPRAGAAGGTPRAALRRLALRDPEPGAGGVRGSARGAVDAVAVAAVRGDGGPLTPRDPGRAYDVIDIRRVPPPECCYSFLLGGRPDMRARTSKRIAKS